MIFSDAILALAEKTPLFGALNKRVINKVSYAVDVRPRPLSMKEDYTTWEGLVNREYSGRHLPAEREFNENLPDLDVVKELFRSTGDHRSNKSSLILPIFAQWFTDSFLRTKFSATDPNFKKNESNHEIDLCQIYGMKEVHCDMLRGMEGGKLKSELIDGEEFPVKLMEKVGGKVVLKKEFEGLYTQENFDRTVGKSSDEVKLTLFACGIEHGNSTMGNTLMNIIWLREHNRIAGVLAAANPTWDDERIFQTARCVNIVLLLKVVIEDYIKHISGFPFRVDPTIAENEKWYRTNHMASEFALLYRWHDLIPDTVTFGGKTESSTKLLKNNAWVMEVGVDQMLLDSSKEAAGKVMLGNTPNFLVEVAKLSLIQGRVSGLASFNDYAEHFGTGSYSSFEDLTGDKETAKKLEEIYGSIDKLEWFTGLWAEKYNPDKKIMGNLLVAMVANDAFTQALTNPLLAEQVFTEVTFTKEGMDIIKETSTLADICARVTKIEGGKGVSFDLIK